MDGEQPPDHRFYLVGYEDRELCDYVTLELDVSKGEKLYFLVDIGVNISLVKSKKLLGTVGFKPKDWVWVKSIGVSIFETYGSTETWIKTDELDIPYHFQLVSKQVDLKGDRILGHDLFKTMQAHIWYKEGLLTFRHEGITVHKR